MVFERFTPQARRALVLAHDEARQLDHGFVGTEHLLLGLLREGEGVAAQAVARLGITLDAVREAIRERSVGVRPAGTGAPPFTPRAKTVLELSLREALDLNHSSIDTEHLLLGLVREGEGLAAEILAGMGADPAKVREQVMTLLAVQGRLRTEPPPGPPSGPPPVGRPRRPLQPQAAIPGQVQARNLLAVAMDASSELERLGEELSRLRDENRRLRARLADEDVDPEDQAPAEGGTGPEPGDPGHPGSPAQP